MRPVGMRGLFGRGHWPLFNHTGDDLIGEATGGKDVFRSRLEEADDALVVGDDQEREVCNGKTRENVVGNDQGWRAAE